MMGNVRTVLGLVVVSLVVIMVMAWGLSRLGDKPEVNRVEVEKLLFGARFVAGDEKAKVTVVEFSDVQCPACRDAEPIAKELRRMEGVRFVYRHFPLVNAHKNALKAAKAVEAVRLIGYEGALLQGMPEQVGVRKNNAKLGFSMLELMFEKQGEWAGSGRVDDLIVGYTKSLGVEEKVFREKWNSEEVAKLVGVDSDLAGELKLAGTPTFFVNGEQVATNFVIGKVKDILQQ